MAGRLSLLVLCLSHCTWRLTSQPTASDPDAPFAMGLSPSTHRRIEASGQECSEEWTDLVEAQELEQPKALSVGPTSAAQVVGAIHGAGDVKVTNSILNVIGRDSHNHTHVHNYGTVKDLKSFLDAISNFRRIQQDTLARIAVI
ncbi:hypothetical protein BKA70DRAFT_502374 [Coprinopsis sp. MPI-PUGE-AT-0042]|nr:hypothetical protein BKA70DRAFT_502374 [Coprinopsis sp. MPI-PUGE-AT-0042]